MPLRVWLPLLGNTDNQGMSENIFTVSNSTYITVDNAGKLGKCYKFNSTESNNGIYSPDNGFMDKYINNHSFSLCAWVNIASDVSSTPVICLSYGLRLIVGNTSAARLNLYNSAGQINCMSSVALNDGKWHHFVGTYDVDTNKMAVYVDGVNTGTATYPSGTYASAWRNGLYIGRDPNSAATTITDSALFRGKLQDIRVYDHALPPKLINEIAKGLVTHYTLNDPYVTDNLFVNGFGQDGLLGWSNSNYSTTEIPSTPNYIKASYTNNNTTTDFLPISHDTTYTFSEYLKASTTSGTTYPSILPYDIDKNFIGNNQCAVGFSPTWRTTLSQPLNPGDTVVHATDLSSWTTDTTSHYYYVAVFGYTDSTGHVYKDFTYTQDSLKFGTQTDKNNLDKTTNTITLLSPYTGKARPAGTAICQATAGSTYFYPFGGISVTTITDWTYKSTVIDPKITNGRLFCAQYIKYLAYPSAYHAGIRLVDNNANKIVCDNSGFSNNSKAVNNIFPSSDTPRNTISTRFVDNTSTVTITPCFSAGQTLTELSVSIWYKTNTLNSTTPNLWSLGENNFVRIRLANATSFWYYIRVGTTPVGTTFAAGKTLTDDTWHHVVLTFKDGVVTVYLDSIQIGKTDHSATATYVTCISAGDTWHLAGYTATAENFIGSLSDFRLYTTCLSAEDVKILYNTPVSIANNGSILTQGEFVEL